MICGLLTSEKCFCVNRSNFEHASERVDVLIFSARLLRNLLLSLPSTMRNVAGAYIAKNSRFKKRVRFRLLMQNA